MTWSVKPKNVFCTHSHKKPCSMVLDCLKSEKPLCLLPNYQEGFQNSSTKAKAVIRVGLGSCGINSGAKKIYNFFKSSIAKNEELARTILLKKTGCLGLCSQEVIVSVEKENTIVFFKNVNIERATDILSLYIKNDLLPDEGVLGVLNGDYESEQFGRTLPFYLKSRVVLKNAGLIDPSSFDEYLISGGMASFNIALKYFNKGQVSHVNNVLTESGLKSLSGSLYDFTGKIWEDFRLVSGDKIVVANAVGSDSSSFVSRSILEGDPFSVLEGLMLACILQDAKKGLIFLNPKYKNAKNLLDSAVKKLYEIGLLGKNILGAGLSLDIEVFLGLDSHVCGVDTAIFEAIQGKRPHPIQSIDDRVNVSVCDLETLVSVVRVVSYGASWFKSIGTSESPGTKVISLSGKVNNVGCYEVPFGTSLREIIFDYGGGLENNKALKAVQIGGPSGSFVPANLIDTPLGYNSLKQVGIRKSFGSIVVLDEDNCIVNQTQYCLREMSQESCGKCIPCREGLYRLVEMLEHISRNGESSDNLKRYQLLSQLEKLAEVIRETSRCTFGQNAVSPLLSGLKYFKEEFRTHIFEGRCIANQCKGLLRFKIDAELCRGCSICLERCPEDAIIGQSKFSHFIIADKCTNCGICHEVCPFEAVEFY